jgi:hypothetical protein
MDQIEWTDEQWEEYYRRTVNVGLDYLDLLTTAAELLARGARLSLEDRKGWESTAASVRNLVDSECERIN